MNKRQTLWAIFDLGPKHPVEFWNTGFASEKYFFCAFSTFGRKPSTSSGTYLTLLVTSETSQLKKEI